MCCGSNCSNALCPFFVLELKNVSWLQLIQCQKINGGRTDDSEIERGEENFSSGDGIEELYERDEELYERVV